MDASFLAAAGPADAVVVASFACAAAASSAAAVAPVAAEPLAAGH